MSTPHEPSEEELRAAYEAELKRLRVEDVLLQTTVSLINLGARKAGLAPETADERDPEQVRLAIEGAKRLLGLIETQMGPDAKQLQDAISQLQLAYVRLGGQAPGAAGAGDEGAPPAGPEQPSQGPQGPGDAQRSGRLWIPGQ